MRVRSASSARLRREPAADGRVDLLGLGGPGDLAGADGPDGLVGDGARPAWRRARTSRNGVDLALRRPRASRRPRARSSVSPTQTIGTKPAAERGRDLLGDERVGLAEELAPLAVADDDPACTRTRCSIGALISPVNAPAAFGCRFCAATLDAARRRSSCATAASAVNGGATTTSTRGDVARELRDAAARASTPSAPPWFIFQLPAMSGRRAGFMRLGSASRRTSMPGSFFPSMSSSEAPPPVEMCLIFAATSVAGLRAPPPRCRRRRRR